MECIGKCSVACPARPPTAGDTWLMSGDLRSSEVASCLGPNCARAAGSVAPLQCSKHLWAPFAGKQSFNMLLGDGWVEGVRFLWRRNLPIVIIPAAKPNNVIEPGSGTVVTTGSDAKPGHVNRQTLPTVLIDERQ